MKSVKTTIFGAITAAALFLKGNANHTVATIGEIFSSVGMILLGFNSKDNNQP
jgi:hypothetical protein